MTRENSHGGRIVRPEEACCGPSRARASWEQSATPQLLAERKPRSVRNAVRVPGGIGLLGTRWPLIAIDGESPARKVRIKPFQLDPCVVTNERFQEFVEQTGYVTDAERIGDSFVFEQFLPADAGPSRAVADAPWWRVVSGASWRHIHGSTASPTPEPDHPVVHVTWNDALAFATWAGGRLPSEAEWEHAARGGLGDVPFPWGDREPNDTEFLPCNIWQGTFPRHNTGADGYVGTAPARSFEPNGYGLYNMIGNVWEWTSDLFKVRSLKRDAIAAHGAKKGYRVNKGGSFLCHASYCYRYRIAARSGSTPDSSTSHQGFRVAYDV